MYLAAPAVFIALDLMYSSLPLAYTTSGLVGGAAGVTMAEDLASVGGLVITQAARWGTPGFAYAASALASAAAIAAAVVVVIVAVVTIVLAAIKFRDELELPGKLAAMIQAARTTPQDAGALADTDSGVATLFDLFAGSTFPAPRPGTCENPVLPQYGYYDEDGQFKHWEMDLTADLCLNPTPVPDAAPADPHFVIRGGEGNSTAPTRVSPSIEFTNAVTGQIGSVRVSGNWFVERFGVTGAAQWTPEGQALSLDYTDWGNTPHHVWLIRAPDGEYLFAGMAESESGVDPDTCQAEGTCWNEPGDPICRARREELRGSAGDLPAVHRHPDDDLQRPPSASPVSFSANDFAPGNAVGALTYQWRFQLAECGGRLPCISRTNFGPAYSDPVAGESASYTWQTSGAFQVELTATDAQGKTRDHHHERRDRQRTTHLVPHPRLRGRQPDRLR